MDRKDTLVYREQVHNHGDIGIVCHDTSMCGSVYCHTWGGSCGCVYEICGLSIHAHSTMTHPFQLPTGECRNHIKVGPCSLKQKQPICHDPVDNGHAYCQQFGLGYANKICGLPEGSAHSGVRHIFQHAGGVCLSHVLLREDTGLDVNTAE